MRISTKNNELTIDNIENNELIIDGKKCDIPYNAGECVGIIWVSAYRSQYNVGDTIDDAPLAAWPVWYKGCIDPRTKNWASGLYSLEGGAGMYIVVGKGSEKPPNRLQEIRGQRILKNARIASIIYKSSEDGYDQWLAEFPDIEFTGRNIDGFLADFGYKYGQLVEIQDHDGYPEFYE